MKHHTTHIIQLERLFEVGGWGCPVWSPDTQEAQLVQAPVHLPEGLTRHVV